MADIFKEFLVRLGYSVDESSQRKMADAVGAMTKDVVKLGVAVEGMAAAVVFGVAKVASNMEKMYYASQRTLSSVKDMEAFAYAMSQVGGSVEDARSSMEGFAATLRNMPGARGIVEGMVGQFNGTADAMGKLGAYFAKASKDPFAYAYAKQQADLLHISESTMQAMARDHGQFVAEFQRMNKLMGVDLDVVAKNATKFMQSLRYAYAAGTSLMQRVAGDLELSLSKDIRRLVDYVLMNSATISKAINVVVRLILDLAGGLTRYAVVTIGIIRDVYNWFERLGPSGHQLVDVLSALGTAWLLLNAKFLTTPLGLLVSLLALLPLLIDDYETWQRTAGKGSLFDWSKIKPGIDHMLKSLRDLRDGFKSFFAEHGDFAMAAGVVVGAMLLINTAFVKSPIGRIFLLATALWAVYESYKRWKDGEKDGFIDWDTWGPRIENFLTKLGEIGTAIDDVVKKTVGWQTVAEVFLGFMAGKFLLGIGGSVTSAIGHFVRLGDGVTKSIGPGSVAVRAAGTMTAMFNRLLLAGLAFGLWYNFLGPGSDYYSGRSGEWGENFEKRRREEQEAFDSSPAGRIKRWYRRKMPTWLGGDPLADATVPPEGAALLSMIGQGESGGKYNVTYGGKMFAGYGDHPNQPETITSGPNAGQTSTAAGRYQFTHGTWKEAQDALDLPDFSPASQDKGAWWLARRDYKQRTGRDLLTDLKSNDPKVLASVGPALSSTWTSLPGGIEPNASTGSFTEGLVGQVRALAERARNNQLAVVPPALAQPVMPPGANNNATTNVTINQDNNITIQGSDPQANARAVQAELNRNTADTARHLQGAVR